MSPHGLALAGGHDLAAALPRRRGRGDDAELLHEARPTSTGGCVIIHGSVVGDPADGRTAVILEPARPTEMAPIIVAAYGLSPREQEVTQLVCRASAPRRSRGGCTCRSTPCRTT